MWVGDSFDGKEVQVSVVLNSQGAMWMETILTGKKSKVPAGVPNE
jgi:hypothetical protein